MDEARPGKAPYLELGSAQVAKNLARYQILDVREPEEFDGPLGNIPGSVLIPLATLPANLGLLRTDQPILVVCKAGIRSAHACRFLATQGFQDLTNLQGGMLGWRTERDRDTG